ncbi:MAG: hypothetical protein JRI23_09335, partial [Deltaproteobacteria bacterium]|nr:hypothetical protein [Deltaproteobacteria bacterium]MBW2531845.1 hypothetical protein [Deltaproteobacteria bacterium]
SLPPAQIHTAPPPQHERRGGSSAPPPSSGPVEKIEVESYKMELAGLLASMRAGALTQGDRKTRHAVARVNEVIEDDLAPESETLQRRVDRMHEIWRQLALVLQTVRQYRWDHPQTGKAIEQALELIAETLDEEPTAVRWDIGTMHFGYAGHTVWKPERPPFDRIPYELFAAGLRKVQFRPGLTADELREFAGVLLQDAALGFGAEDDAATAMWDRKFEHIAYLAVDAFAEGDDPEFEKHRDEIAKQLAELAAMSEDGEDLLGSYMEIHREVVGEVVAELAEKMRETLGRDVDLSDEQWLGRYSLGFVEGCDDATAQGDLAVLLDSLTAWSQEQIAAKVPATAFRALGALTEAFAAERDKETAQAFREQALAAMFPPDQLQAVLEEVGGDIDPDPAVVDGVSLALEIMADDGFFDTAVEHYARTASEPLRAALVAYLVRFISGHEEQVAQLLTTANADDALQLLDRLHGLGGTPAVRAVTAAFGSVHAEVRTAALVCLPVLPPAVAATQLERILEDRDAGVRRKALETIGAFQVGSALETLCQRVEADSYHDVPLRERRLTLETVGKLDRVRAETIAIGLLQKQQLFRSDAIEQTRSIAADFLATSQSQEALDALTKASKSRFYASSELRITAKRAADAVFQRRSLIPPPKGGDK